VAVVVAREGRLPVGADEVVAEAGGAAVVVGSGALTAAGALLAATRVAWAETGEGFRPAELTERLVPLLAPTPLVILPASADGRDLAPRLAAALDRPLVSRAIEVRVLLRSGTEEGGTDRVRATVTRLDDRVLLPAEVHGPAVVTLVSGTRTVMPTTGETIVEPLPGVPPTDSVDVIARRPDPQVTAVLPPDPRTMDLADAVRVLAGGAGLVAGCDDQQAVAVFELLGRVAAALGGSAGATRVATDAGWTGYERQIGTTGVTIDPELYMAFGISGAAQHVGGLGSPRHIISVNTDPSCPMTAMADLGLVTDARGLLDELGRRLIDSAVDNGAVNDSAVDNVGHANVGHDDRGQTPSEVGHV
jgi:electron transfer flavoprotein alpha subunit